MISIGADTRDILKPKGFHIEIGNLLISTLAINILSLALPVMTLQIYDRILPSQGSGTLPVLIAGVCLAVTLEAALRLTRSYALGWAGAAYEHRLSCEALQHILNADLSALGPYGIGENMGRMTAIGKLKDFYNGYSLTVLCELVFVPVFLGVIIYIAGPLSFIPAAVLMIFTIVSLLQGKRVRSALQERDETDDIRYNFLIEGLEGIHTVKSFALENIFSRRYETLEESSTVANYNVTEATASTFNAGSIFSHLMVASVIACGAVFVLHGSITTGALIATVLLSGRMLQPIQRALALWIKYQDFSLARGKVETLFETPQHLYIPDIGLKPERDGTLVIQNLSFRFSENHPWLFQDINMSLKRGDSVLLDAAHGAGKTTFLEILSGLYPATRGEVIVDGHNILSYQPEKIIGHIGYIQTEGLIFRGTIRDNLTCFGQIDEYQVREVSKLLKVDSDIARLPSGLDTFLSGNNTDNIPPGLKQRIAMVRVLAPKPRIILFDDADRALDREGYNLVYNLLAQLSGRVAMIIISDDFNLRGLAEYRLTLTEKGLCETENACHTAHVRPNEELPL